MKEVEESDETKFREAVDTPPWSLDARELEVWGFRQRTPARPAAGCT